MIRQPLSLLLFDILRFSFPLRFDIRYSAVLLISFSWFAVGLLIDDCFPIPSAVLQFDILLFCGSLFGSLLIVFNNKEQKWPLHFFSGIFLRCMRSGTM